ncbi:MAG: hypothetical protein NTY37_08585 [Methanothrix sp.]|nr:hypothetical protein [Methanothrix sp.]
MSPLAGWDGPDCIADGIFRYSKCISGIRLYIDVEGGCFYGGTCGACANFDVEREGGRWMRFETDLTTTPAGELVMRLRGYSTWEVVYERISEGTVIDETTESIEDLAVFLERCFVRPL